MSRHSFAPLAAAALLFLMTASAPAVAQDSSTRPAGPPSATPVAEPPAGPAGDGTGVRLSTDQGDIVIGLFTESAPVASENFVNLVESGFYDGLTFHRLVPGFVIQGGDPAGDGTGGPGYTIEDEPVVGRYGRGVVAMARTQAPDSQGSQFFVVLDDEAEGGLEYYRTYSIFGRVVEGMEVVDAIAAMPNSGDLDGNRALEPVTITSATVEQVALPPEPEREPLVTPGPGGDPDLEAAIPAQVGGQALELISFTGVELMGAADPAGPTAELPALLEEVGGSIEGFSVASGQAQVEDQLVGVIAARLAGADASSLLDRLPTILLGYEGGERTTATVAGREVTVFEPYAGAPPEEGLHVFARTDTLWMVLAQEPYLSELVGAIGE